MVNQELMKACIAALRSGSYKQGRSVLRDTGNNYCALGVIEETVQGIDVWRYAPRIACYATHNGAFNTLSWDTTEKLGLDQCDTGLTVGDRCVYEYNDSGETFAKIADRLEAPFITPNPFGEPLPPADTEPPTDTPEEFCDERETV